MITGVESEAEFGEVLFQEMGWCGFTFSWHTENAKGISGENNRRARKVVRDWLAVDGDDDD